MGMGTVLRWKGMVVWTHGSGGLGNGCGLRNWCFNRDCECGFSKVRENVLTVGMGTV